MYFSRYNLPKIFLSFVLTLGLLLGSYFVYLEYGIAKPLKKSLMETSSIKQAGIEKKGQKLIIRVELHETDSLQAAYYEIAQTIPSRGSFILVFEDNRDEYLTELWKYNRFFLEEAAILGNLTDMRENIAKSLIQADLEQWNIDIDKEHLYFQLHKNDVYLYEIIPRKSSFTEEIIDETFTLEQSR